MIKSSSRFTRGFRPPVSLITFCGLFFCVIVLISEGCRSVRDQKVIPIESAAWLHGRWTLGHSERFENFVYNDGNYLERVIFQLEDGQPVISERARIFEKDGSLAMTTTIFENDANELAIFDLVDQKFHLLRFRNIRDDDPHTITFELSPQGSVLVTEREKSGKQIKKYELLKQGLP